MSNYQQQQYIQSSSSTFPQQSQNIRKINPHQIIPLEQRINPNGLPPQMLINYDKHSIETLCTLGKELVLELMTRMFSIVNTLKLNIKGENKSGQKNLIPNVENVDNVRLQLEYSRLIFMALTEIRLRIDLKLFKELKNGQTLKTSRPSDSNLIELLSNQNSPKDLQKLEMSKKFENNRQKLLKINCEMKKLEWISINSDPSIFIIGNENNEQKKIFIEERAKSRQS
ncbi:hypothetical protein ACQ4LE_000585 [Meloidogyne hapla]